MTFRGRSLLFSNVFSSVCDLMIIFFLVFSCDHVISCTHHTGTNIFFLFFSSASSMWLLRCGLVPVPSPTLSQSHIVSESWRGLPWQDALLLELPLFLDCQGELLIHCAEANIPRIKFEPVSVSHNQVISKSMQVFTDQLHTQGFGVCPRCFPASRWIALQLHNAPLPWTEAARLWVLHQVKPSTARLVL